MQSDDAEDPEPLNPKPLPKDAARWPKEATPPQLIDTTHGRHQESQGHIEAVQSSLQGTYKPRFRLRLLQRHGTWQGAACIRLVTWTWVCGGGLGYVEWVAVLGLSVRT